jgi:hypothetical protein
MGKGDPFKDSNPYRTNPLSIHSRDVTIMVIYLNGNIREIRHIENPWAYMKEIKKNPNVKTCFIKEK